MKYSCVTFWVFVMSSCWEKGFSFKWPSRILVVGPASCGKTTFIKRLLLGNLYLFETRPHASVIIMGHGEINSIPCRNTASNFLKVYPPTITWKNGPAINKGQSWTTSCQKGETTKTFWICSLSILTISTSPCSTCVETCFQKKNMRRPFRETPNTS